ncbi:hypothetical protein AB4Z17_27885 [Paenibacillus sp. TAF43_2]|uniref:hypothetical protein n=1 Tax=Paenibacillus sp. TAF43_2 TaxID=3233069 RepID=UPI003F96F92B
MEEMYRFSRNNMNCRVRVRTRDGRCHEGVIVNVDRNNVYLRTSDRVRTSAYYGNGYDNGYGYGYGYGFGAGLLTLSLFSLLAIALI